MVGAALPSDSASVSTPLLAHYDPGSTDDKPSGSRQREGSGAGRSRQSLRFTVDEAVDDLGVGRFQYIMFTLVGMAFMGEAAKQTVVAFIAPVVGGRVNDHFLSERNAARKEK